MDRLGQYCCSVVTKTNHAIAESAPVLLALNRSLRLCWLAWNLAIQTDTVLVIYAAEAHLPNWYIAMTQECVLGMKLPWITLSLARHLWQYQPKAIPIMHSIMLLSRIVVGQRKVQTPGFVFAVIYNTKHHFQDFLLFKVSRLGVDLLGLQNRAWIRDDTHRLRRAVSALIQNTLQSKLNKALKNYTWSNSKGWSSGIPFRSAFISKNCWSGMPYCVAMVLGCSILFNYPAQCQKEKGLAAY